MGAAIAAKRVVTPDGIVGPAAVRVEDGRILSISPVDLAPDRTLAPGFVDLQVNGFDDVHVARADGDAWDRLDGLLAPTGVTSWCPTLVTAALDDYGAPLARIAEAALRPGARPQIAGAHLEGPFLARPGAHDPALLRDPDPRWLSDLPPIVRVVTLAPERAGALEAIARLVERGTLVAIGHTEADAERMHAAVEAGAELVTHVFNGMPAMHHRQAGPALTSLVDDRLATSVIADLVHVHPAALALLFRAKPPGGVVLVTDAVAWRSPTAGSIAVDPATGAPRLPDGTLAGSALTMDAAVRNTVAAGVPLDAALGAASTTPARLLGLADRGRIVPGCRADLVALDDDLGVTTTWVAGEEVHAC